MAHQDFKEFFELLHVQKVEFLIIGGVAYNYYAPPRATKDIDVWVAPSTENCARLIAALHAFGFPTASLDAAALASQDSVYILGKAPNRIDLLTHPGGVEWPDAWARRTSSDYNGVAISLHPWRTCSALSTLRKPGAERPREARPARPTHRRQL